MSKKHLSLLAVTLVVSLTGHRAAAQVGWRGDTYNTAISDQQVRRFAAAVVTLSAIDRRYMERNQEAGVTHRDDLREGAASRMKETIRAHGLSLGTFNRIVAQAEHDQALASRIHQYVRLSAAGLQ